MRYQCSPSRLIAIEAWVLLSSGFSLRAFRQTGHPQFHCGTPPPRRGAQDDDAKHDPSLLEIRTLNANETPNAYARNVSRWTPARDTFPRSGTCQARRSTFVNLENTASAYLRAAHAYMLISMPTGTSTIFGAFQAIWHSFWNRTNSALSHKLVRKENFASEIFCHRPPSVYMLRRKSNLRGPRHVPAQNSVRSTASLLPASAQMAMWLQRARRAPDTMNL